jgi:hypothetical protein
MTAARALRLLGAVVCVLMIESAFGVPGCGVALAEPVPGVAWQVMLVAQPTNLALTGSRGGEPIDQYVIELTNTGSVASSGPITLTDALPAGVTVGGPPQSEKIDGGEGWVCPIAEGQIVTCAFHGSVAALGRSPLLTIPVAVTATGTLTDAATVSGGGAPVASARRSTEAGAPAPPLEVLDGFSLQASDLSGAPATQAGGHPNGLTTILNFPYQEVTFRGPERPVGRPRDMEIDLPPGLVGDPQAATRCPIVRVFAHTCPASSRVGSLYVNLSQRLFLSEDNAGEGVYPIFNVVPERGYPAEFGLFVEGIERPVFIYASVDPGPGYNVHISVPDIPAVAELNSAIVTFFGNPQGADETGDPPVPFFTNPSDCSGAPLVTKMKVNSWEEPSHWLEKEAVALPVAGCDLLQFLPSFSVAPESTVADEPSGYTFDLRVPQATAGLEGTATPDVKDVSVTLPAGLSLSPPAADGLLACPAEGPEGINLTSPGAGHCPPASQIGTVKAVTPLLAEPVEGQVYLAQPGCGGAGQPACGQADALDGNLYALYLQLEGSGVVVKLRGTASANPATGQLTATFKDNPQLPVSDLKLTLKGGPLAPLANPQQCGQAVTTTDITPWSSPETPDATPSSVFPVTGCEGSPFAPSFLAGTTTTAAGAYTSFTTTIARADRMQSLGAIQVQTPPGLLGMLSHVTLCQEPQAAQGACSSASRIGTSTAASGAGSHPFWVAGPVYLTGPYKGAPFGLSIAVPAKAGPFNLGTVVVRAAINVDPDTSILTVTSDPLPQILDGVPLRVQTVNVTIDRSQFMFNPTSCTAQQITAKIASAQGSTVTAGSPFAAGGCRNLPFNPQFKVATQAKTSKAKGASLDVKVVQPAGSANIRRVELQLPTVLPARLTTLQKACTQTQFAANPAGCPAGSVIGFAEAITPVLNVPLTGPAFLVSHGGAAFPDVVFVLQGQGVRIDLTGKTDIKKGITYSRFETVPDAPVSSFETYLPEGPHSVLSAYGSLCAKKLLAPTTIEGQNGARVEQSTTIRALGCPKTSKKRATKARRSRVGRRANAGTARSVR